MSTIQTKTSTGFQMPVLIYPTSALSPVISQTTIEHHYGKHLQTYVDNLNKLVSGSEYEGLSLREIVEHAPQGPLFNNAGQVLNHALYFEQFTPYPPGNNRPNGTLLSAIHFDFGNFETMKKKMEESAASLFGSGWVWLAQDENGKLNILSCHNGDNPIRHRMAPLYGIDVWEHAYYLDYQNRRAEHVQRLWEIVDWEMVESRMNM
ncbi:MAG: superoxide dismutase [Bacteroidaceae bacterium]|nr:superoxide dismutase [Bacteroidaceae bacterium]